MKKLIFVVVCCILYVILWVTHYQCVFLKYLHVICPGCGMMRATHEILRLNFREAFEYHPMVYSLPVLLLYVLKAGKPFKNMFINYGVLTLIALGFLLNYVIKLFIFF
ncbi:MAG: DUF2752 domain-containing protein [Candidatus Ornithomonoglobus sp.]